MDNISFTAVVFIVIVCIIIVAAIIYGVIYRKQHVIYPKTAGGDTEIGEFISEFNNLCDSGTFDGNHQNVINTLLNNYYYDRINPLTIVSDKFKQIYNINYTNNVLKIIQLGDKNYYCELSVIYSAGLNFRCVYNLNQVHFEEITPLTNIDELINKIDYRISDYLNSLFRELKREFQDLYIEKIKTPPRHEIKILNDDDDELNIYTKYDIEDVKMKFYYTGKSDGSVLVDNIQDIIALLKSLFSDPIKDLRRKYNNGTYRKSGLSATMENGELAITSKKRKGYKLIIGKDSDNLYYIPNVPYIPIRSSTRSQLLPPFDLDKIIKEFFEQNNLFQPIIDRCKVIQGIEIRQSSSIFIRSKYKPNFIFKIELTYDDNRHIPVFHYTEDIPYIVEINQPTGIVNIDDIDILMTRIKTFFKPLSHEGGASKDDTDPNTQIILPGILYDQNINPRNLYYRGDNNGEMEYRYPNLVNVDDNNYSINLMWISRYIDLKNKYIGGYVQREDTQFENIFPPQIAKWMILNPAAMVNLWIDSKMCTSEQIKNTREYMYFYIKSMKTRGINISESGFAVRDIQSLVIVNQYPIIAMVEWPIYSRVDLLRLIAAYETQLSNNKKNIRSAFIYADYTVNPHSIREVYPNGISEDGFIGISSTYVHSGYENSYMIFGSYNIYLLSTIRDFILSILCKIQVESRGYVLEPFNRVFYDTHGNFASGQGNCLSDTFPYGLFIPVMFVSTIRKTLYPYKYNYFDCTLANTNPDNRALWYIFYGFMHHGDKLQIEINNKLYWVRSELNVQSKNPIDYMCVIQDERVSVIRSSGHGASSTYRRDATSLHTIISSNDKYFKDKKSYDTYIGDQSQYL